MVLGTSNLLPHDSGYARSYGLGMCSAELKLIIEVKWEIPVLHYRQHLHSCNQNMQPCNNYGSAILLIAHIFLFVRIVENRKILVFSCDCFTGCNFFCCKNQFELQKKIIVGCPHRRVRWICRIVKSLYGGDGLVGSLGYESGRHQHKMITAIRMSFSHSLALSVGFFTIAISYRGCRFAGTTLIADL